MPPASSNKRPKCCRDADRATDQQVLAHLTSGLSTSPVLAPLLLDLPGAVLDQIAARLSDQDLVSFFRSSSKVQKPDVEQAQLKCAELARLMVTHDVKVLLQFDVLEREARMLDRRQFPKELFELRPFLLASACMASGSDFAVTYLADAFSATGVTHIANESQVSFLCSSLFCGDDTNRHLDRLRALRSHVRANQSASFWGLTSSRLQFELFLACMRAKTEETVVASLFLLLANASPSITNWTLLNPAAQAAIACDRAESLKNILHLVAGLSTYASRDAAWQSVTPATQLCLATHKAAHCLEMILSDTETNLTYLIREPSDAQTVPRLLVSGSDLQTRACLDVLFDTETYLAPVDLFTVNHLPHPRPSRSVFRAALKGPWADAPARLVKMCFGNELKAYLELNDYQPIYEAIELNSLLAFDALLRKSRVTYQEVADMHRLNYRGQPDFALHLIKTVSAPATWFSSLKRAGATFSSFDAPFLTYLILTKNASAIGAFSLFFDDQGAKLTQFAIDSDMADTSDAEFTLSLIMGHVASLGVL